MLGEIDFKMVKKEYTWINLGRLLGIFSVILGHLWLNNSKVTIYIYSFHMPFFFFLSGFVFKKRKIKDVIIKGFHKLIIPYLLIFPITYVWWLFTTFPSHPELYENTVMDKFVKPLLGFFIANGRDTSISIMPNKPLWFLPSLFFTRIIFSFFISQKNILHFLFVFFILGCTYFINKTSFFIPFGITPVFPMYLFFLLGYLSRDIYKYITSFNKYLLFLVGILISVIFFFICQLNGRVDVASLYLGKIYLFYINSFLEIIGLMFILISLECFEKKVVMFRILYSNTLLIMAFQGIFISIVNRVYHYIFRFDYNQLTLFQGILVSITVLLSTKPFLEIYQRLLFFTKKELKK